MVIPRKKKTGGVLLLCIASFFILSLLAFVTDIGFMYYQKARIQTAVNAAWKGGMDLAVELTNGPLSVDQKNKVCQRVREIIVQNGFPPDEVASKTRIEFFDYDRGFEVAASASFGLFFARLMGFDMASVYSERTNIITDAESGATFTPRLAIPLAIPHGVVKDLTPGTFSVSLFPEKQKPDSSQWIGFQPGEEYIIKLGSGVLALASQTVIVSSTSVASRAVRLSGALVEVPDKHKNCFGVVNLENTIGSGTKDYRNRMIFGFNKPLRVNFRIINEPENLAEQADQAVYQLTHDEKGKLLEIPNRKARVVVPITNIPSSVSSEAQNRDAKTLYELSGIDAPNGKYTPEAYNFKASSRITGFAEFEILPSEHFTRVGNNIQAGDNGDLGPYQKGQIRGKFLRYLAKPGEIAQD
ncbi:MAG: Tad domain-containing protein [Candidatus Riflebacteria bacterium]|nr:Tad domain-containing protein [Candidatus Riflebacteria bacterium]